MQAEPVPVENLVVLVMDGPLCLHGRFEIAPEHGPVEITDTRVALCRCGASNNKPFCDGSHKQAGLQDAERWSELPPQPETSPEEGSLRVTCLTNGPLLLQGGALRAADGTTEPGMRAAACLCVASANKSFYDGGHKRIGFTA